LTFITPDKWISKSFGLALRERKYKKLVSILNAGRDIFASAKVDSIISVFNNSNINEYISVFQFEDEGIKHTRDYKISKLNHPYALDYIFSGHIDLLEKLEGFVPSEQEYLCENACATSDAYKLKDLLIDLDEEYSEEYLKIINTGTIDKWTSKWGEKEMTYLGDKYLRPVVSREKFVKLFRNSYSEKSIKQKIILKGLNLLDACLDIKGCIIPGKSTLIITAKDIFYLKFIMAILNSPITFFYLRERYPSSSYNQGTTFTKDMINNLPLPRISKEEEKEVVFLVDEILRVKNLSLKEGKISELEEDLNDIIMGGFELTEDQTKRILDSI